MTGRSASVFFDLDGTVVHYETTERERLSAVCERYGVAPTDDLWDFYVDRLVANFESHAEDPFRATAWDLVRKTGVPADPARLGDRLKRVEVESTYVPDAVRAGLATVAEEYPTGVLTNGYGPVQREKLDRHDLGPLFDAVVVASEERTHKPDPGAFAAARARLPADRHVLVGDSVETDLPARDHGFATVILGQEDVEAADAVLEGPEEFSRLSGVLRSVLAAD